MSLLVPGRLIRQTVPGCRLPVNGREHLLSAYRCVARDLLAHSRDTLPTSVSDSPGCSSAS